MFSPQERSAIVDRLIHRAQSDDEIIGASFIGSAARGEVDEWSDIDLALQLRAGLEPASVADKWTTWLGDTEAISDTFDISGGGGLYRVHLLTNSLQIDLSFFPPAEYCARGGDPMLTVYGDPAPAQPVTPQDWHASARKGWLYLLHARSALLRGRSWQCEVMLADLRATILALAAERNDLRSDHARTAHLLPTALTARLSEARASQVKPGELCRSLTATASIYLAEIRTWDPAYGDRLDPAVASLVSSCTAGTESK